ncbi:peptidylprolyl isomerase [Methylovirgula sp. HY1]|uniref:peptidylprolyl isomerase n=1 Tax=Methylovirgula sp. HY1 TaxID=2822761 RepID=UPI001C5B2050|nr:peptidylprolyl isomerase [Methylovirgula sp. HY1]QXX73942.1 Peptidyl-prolyl cis-trans isomerase D [Methylovirgula sp. HY1]
MLDAMRAATQNWIGRTIMTIVMGLLIFAFGFWGIADIFRGFGANELAHIGSDTISVDTYRNAYQTELQGLQQRAHRAITNQQARQMGLDRQVLTRLVSESVLDQETRRLGLALGNHDLAEEIIRDDAFKGPNGKFDRQLFENRLQEAGLTEQTFVAEQRRAYLRRQIITALTAGLEMPQTMLDAIHRYYDETRSIDYIVLPQSTVGKIAPPNESVLKAYYDARRQGYRTREYRKVTVLAVTLKSLSEQLAKTAPISQADLKKYYEQVKAARFTVPEKRHLQQIVFPNKAAADAASKQLAGGTSFDALIKERKLTEKDIDLGTVTKSDMVDPTIAAAAFALPQDQVSQPIKGKFGWVLLRVAKILPGSVTPFEKVALPLRQELLLIHAHQEINKIHDKIEDQRDAGKTLAEAAKSVGLTVRTVELDSEGYNKSGQPLTDLPDLEALVKAVFASDVGVDNAPLSTQAGGTVWFEVKSIDPAHQQSFAEVKDAVTLAWTQDERAKRLAAKADALVKKLKGGETLAALATEMHSDVKHQDGVKRSGGTGLSQGEVAQIFDQKVGGIGSATAASGDRMIFEVVGAKVPPIDPKDKAFNKIVAGVKTSLSEDVIDQYLGVLGRDLGIKINQQALRTAIGSE